MANDGPGLEPNGARERTKARTRQHGEPSRIGVGRRRGWAHTLGVKKEWRSVARPAVGTHPGHSHACTCPSACRYPHVCPHVYPRGSCYRLDPADVRFCRKDTARIRVQCKIAVARVRVRVCIHGLMSVCMQACIDCSIPLVESTSPSQFRCPQK